MKKLRIKSHFIAVFILLFTVSAFSQQNSAVTDSSLIVGYDEVTKIIDGDTFKFRKLDKSSRLLCIDTEETFKGNNAEEKINEIADRWPDYYFEKKIDKNSSMPVKVDSPFGYQSMLWAIEFFKDVEMVRLERDDNMRDVDVFGRYLLYVIAVKNGKEINYNVECVKHGYSPYFTKYGFSKRFHKDFVDAQKYAMDNKLGIWNPLSLCYPDYPDRIKWWDKRADQLVAFDLIHSSDKNYFSLLQTDEQNRLDSYAGKEIIVFGNITEVFNSRYPYLLRFSFSKEKTLDLVIFEEDSGVFGALNINELREYYFYAKGTLENRNGKLRIIIRSKDQIYFE